MNIKSLDVSGFHGLNDFAISFPDTGSVVITGANGTGKSTIIEAMCWAAWGKTLRGVSPGGDDEAPCVVELTTDKVYIVRTRENGRTKVGWKHHDNGTFTDPPEFPTMSAAQEALESIIGDFGLWARGKVFSSSDAVYFSMASDKERKRLLEEVLGIDKFDNAYALCRTDTSVGKSNLSKLEQGEGILLERLKGLKNRIGDYKSHAESVTIPAGSKEDLTVKVSKLNKQWQEARSEWNGLNKNVAAHKKEITRLESRIDFEDEQVVKLMKESCPTCGQKIDVTYRDSAVLELSATRNDLSVECTHKQDELKLVEEEWDDLSEECNLISDAMSNSKNQLVTLAQFENARKDIESNKQQLINSVEDHETELEKLQDEKLELSGKMDVLGDVSNVLNTRGVRAHIITNALDGLTKSANTWLTKLDPNLKVELSGETTQSSGKIVDTISLHVHGAGGGKGYKALSSGQRRRVDVALMLGLGAIAEAASERSGAFLFDEVFDALDADGVSDIVDVLTEISTDRMVLVITHNQELAEAIPAVTRLTAPLNKV